jgi:uncharacterized membrane protein
MLLLHFPAALLPMDFICSLLAVYFHNPYFAFAGTMAGIGGVGLGLLAGLAGAADIIPIVNKGRQKAIANALIHGGLNLTVVIGYGLIVYMNAKHYPDIPFDSTGKIITKAFFIGLMLVGNFIGGNLILKDKVLD